MDFQEIRSGWDERSPSGRAYLAEGSKAVDMRHHEVEDDGRVHFPQWGKQVVIQKGWQAGTSL